MFNDSKYSNWYFSIIKSAVNDKTRSRYSSYFERHHIIPKSLGGTNRGENLVLLTGKEHFICHLLLTKMLSGEPRGKMLHAFMLMKGKYKMQDRYYNSRSYQSCRKEFGEAIRKLKTGSIQTEETKKKISEKLKGHKHISDEGRKQISVKAKTRKREPWSLEYRQKMSESMKRSHESRR